MGLMTNDEYSAYEWRSYGPKAGQSPRVARASRGNFSAPIKGWAGSEVYLLEEDSLEGSCGEGGLPIGIWLEAGGANALAASPVSWSLATAFVERDGSPSERPRGAKVIPFQHVMEGSRGGDVVRDVQRNVCGPMRTLRIRDE
jgi:hypothetical protein